VAVPDGRTNPDDVTDPGDGHRIVLAAWVSDALFAATAIPLALGATALKPVALGLALAMFVLGIGVWAWAFLVAIVRSANGDDIVVSSMFLIQGPVPRRVRAQLFWALGLAVVVAVGTGTADAFGILMPMLPLGLIGLWGAKYGTFPPRREQR
jgi:hypothetical protein